MTDELNEAIVDELNDALRLRDVQRLVTCIRKYPSLLDASVISEGTLQLIIQNQWLGGIEAYAAVSRNVSMPGQWGDTPLQVAVTEGNTEIVEWLLQHGADPNAGHPRGSTAIVRAAALASMANDDRMLRLLLARGVELDIHASVMLGSMEAVSASLQRNPNAIREDPERGRFVSLAIRAHDGYLRAQAEDRGRSLTPEEQTTYLRRLLELLLAHGAEIDGREGPCTALHNECSSSAVDPRVAELLIELGADVNAKNGLGQTPLDLALIVGSPAGPVLQAHGGVTTRRPVHWSESVLPHLQLMADRLEQER
jgi:hypothetical protein